MGIQRREISTGSQLPVLRHPAFDEGPQQRDRVVKFWRCPLKIRHGSREPLPGQVTGQPNRPDGTGFPPASCAEISWMESPDNVPCCRSASAHPAAIAGSTSRNPARSMGTASELTLTTPSSASARRFRSTSPKARTRRRHASVPPIRLRHHAAALRAKYGRSASSRIPLNILTHSPVPASPSVITASSWICWSGLAKYGREQAFCSKVSNGDEVRGGLQPNVENPLLYRSRGKQSACQASRPPEGLANFTPVNRWVRSRDARSCGRWPSGNAAVQRRSRSPSGVTPDAMI